jgi:hypothetical protein
MRDSSYTRRAAKRRLLERVPLYDEPMTFALITVAVVIAVVILLFRILFRIDHSLAQANRNLEQIASALRTKS